MRRSAKQMNTMISKTLSIQHKRARTVGTVVEATGEGPRSRLRGSKMKNHTHSPVLVPQQHHNHQQKQTLSSHAAVGASAVGMTSPANVAYNILNRYRALVLDASYRPIDVINWQRAICMDLLQKADVLEYYDTTINSVSEQFFLPAVIRAKWYGGNVGRFSRVPFNRRNVMLRDGLRCQYCGKTKDLTLDHVIPQSKGGPNTWENLVTACAPCNTRKGDSTLRELRWKLMKKPREPSPWDMGIILSGLGIPDVEKVPTEWSNYLFSSGSDTD